MSIPATKTKSSRTPILDEMRAKLKATLSNSMIANSPVIKEIKASVKNE